MFAARRINRITIQRSWIRAVGSDRLLSTASNRKREFSTFRRRRRKVFESVECLPITSQTSLETPFEISEDTAGGYLAKANLSPWVPIPEAVCRKMFDIASARPEDFHVDLGAGDGRVNFQALDYGVKRSMGVDIDKDILEKARDRLKKRHPPPNLEFHVADLMDPTHSVWDTIKEATIITMYFVDQGARMLAPILADAVRGRKIRVIACGDPIPDWEPELVETILGMQIYKYNVEKMNEWGATEETKEDFWEPQRKQYDYSGDELVVDPSGTTKRVQRDILAGYDPAERIDDHWDDFEQPAPEVLEEAESQSDSEDGSEYHQQVEGNGARSPQEEINHDWNWGAPKK